MPYLVSLKSLDASASLGTRVGMSTSWCNKLPHLDGLVQTSGNKILSVWCEGDGVNRVLVTVRAFQALNKISCGSIPDTNTLVERTSRNILGIWGDRNSGDAIFDTKGQDVLTSLDIPKTDSTISTSGCNGATIASKIKRINVLLVTSECVSDGSGLNIPHLLIISMKHN